MWTESEELRRFVPGYLAMLPVRKDPSAIDQRFIEYLLALTDGVTGRIIVGIDHLLVAGPTYPPSSTDAQNFEFWHAMIHQIDVIA